MIRPPNALSVRLAASLLLWIVGQLIVGIKELPDTENGCTVDLFLVGDQAVLGIEAADIVYGPVHSCFPRTVHLTIRM